MAFKRESYSGIPAASALAMALMESSGIRQMIDDACTFDGQRHLSPGNAVKAMIGPIFDARRKEPLSGIANFYHVAPVEQLFGPKMTLRSLNDQAFGRSLDALYLCDRKQLLWDCSDRICDMFGLTSHIYHMDSSDFSIYSLDEKDEEEFEAIPSWNMHPKDGRKGLKQYAMQTITDGNQILRFMQPYSGNTSDCVMDSETLRFLKDHTDPTKSIVIADCKLANIPLVREMMSMDMGFVTKCPADFGNNVFERIRYSVEHSTMDPSYIRDGWEVYDTDDIVDGYQLRFVAYRIPMKKAGNLEYLRVQGERQVKRIFSRFGKETFSCEKDAMEQFALTLKKLKGSAYDVSATFISFEERERRVGRGRPKKDYVPNIVTKWKVDVSYVFNEEVAERMAGDEDIRVLVTNLPRKNTDTVDLRTGADADQVLRLYLDEYKVESNFRLMKSGMGVDSVYLQTPSRESAMMFVIGVATLLSDIMTRVLKDAGIGKTMRTVCKEFMTVIVKKDGDGISVMGSDDSIDRLERYVELFGLNPDDLLGVF